MFAYQGVYQRHLLKHKENSELDENEIAPMIAESLRLADEIGMRDRKSVRVLDEEELEPQEEGPEVESKEAEYEELTAEEDEHAELNPDEEEKIALKLKNKTKLEGSIRFASS